MRLPGIHYNLFLPRAVSTRMGQPLVEPIFNAKARNQLPAALSDQQLAVGDVQHSGIGAN